MFKLILAASALAILQTQILAQDANQNQQTKNAGQNQQTPQQLEETVVTAEKTKVPISQVGSDVTVITEDQIKESNITSTDELIQTLGGLTVAKTGPIGGESDIFLRGANSNDTLVLIDGVKVNSPTTGGFDFSTITTDNIEKIEILRGPQSSLYGSEAMGGVINIITKKGAGKPSLTLTSEGGSFKTDKEGLNFTYGDDKGDFSLSQSHLGTAGIPAASFLRGNDVNDGDQNWTTSGRFGLNFAKDGRIDYSFRYINSEIGLAGISTVTGLPIDDPDFTQLEHSFFSSLVVKKPITDWWTPTLKLSVANDTLAGRDNDDVAELFFIHTMRKDLELQNEIKVADFYSIVAGYEYKNDSGTIQGSFADSILSNSFYLENRFNIAKTFFFTLGVRNDDYDTFGDHTTFRSTAALLINSIDAKFHASAGTGFRAPALDELFFPGFGVPTLKPESSQGYDIGIQKFLFNKKVSIDPTFFSNRFHNLIAAGPPLFMAENIDEARSSGVEVPISLLNITKGVNANFSYTYNDTMNITTDSQLPRRPRDKAVISIDYKPFQKLTITPSYLMERSRIEFDGTSMSDYAIVNLNVNYMVKDNFKIYGQIVNLFNRQYEDVKGFSSYPFSFYFGTQILF